MSANFENIMKTVSLSLALTCSLVFVAATGYAGDVGATNAGVVQRYGWLQVKKGQLCDQAGDAVQLRGMSTHDLKPFPFRATTLSNLVAEWHVSVVRAAMYTDSYGSSYIKEPKVKDSVKLIVDEALRNDVYVIVDWHILQDGDPNQYKTQAKAFFEEMATTYGSHPNVIYEICNEPNGSNVTWPVIKSYAEFIIPAIRAIDPKAVVIVGTDTWSQGVRAAAQSPLDFPNVMYALHFYTGTHRDELRNNASYALSKGLPIFVTEWGLTDYSGKGPLYLEEGQKWVDWMNLHKISWTSFSFSNCDEGSAALKATSNMDGPWTDDDLSPGGKWIKAKMASE
jgi:endoglucanase